MDKYEGNSILFGAGEVAIHFQFFPTIQITSFLGSHCHESQHTAKWPP
jgi:hypothetical protein